MINIAGASKTFRSGRGATIALTPVDLTIADGIALALKSLHDDRAAFKKWAQGYFKDLEPALFDAAFVNNAAMYMKTPVPTRAQFQRNVEFLDSELKLLNQPGIPGSFRFDDAWDLSFVEKAMAGL